MSGASAICSEVATPGQPTAAESGVARVATRHSGTNFLLSSATRTKRCHASVCRSNPWRSQIDATEKDVGIGGAGLAAAAIELGLVDELRMFRNPVVVGGGTPFLPPVTEEVRLDLVETRTFGSRVIYERYGRARDESD
jgi:dihydrofolate reductase